MSRNPISLACLLLPLLAASCGCGETRCDPREYTAHCEGDEMVFCLSGLKHGIDFGTYVTRSPCDDFNTCHDFGGGEIGCIHEPLTKCDPWKFEGECVGPKTRLICSEPSTFVFDNYVYAVPALDCGKKN